MIEITPNALIIIILMLTTALLITTLGIIHRLNSLLGVIPLFLFYIMAFIWLFVYLIFLAYSDHGAALYFYRLLIPVKSYMYVFLMLFAMHFTKPNIHTKKQIMTVSLIVPSIVLILTFIAPETIFRRLDIIMFSPTIQLSIINGVWFYIDAVYGYICLLLAIVFFIGHYRVSSILYKWQSSIFLFSVGGYLMLDLYNISSGYNDIGGVFGLVALCLILFYTYLYFKTSDLSFLAIGTVFNKVSSIIIVVEDNGKILFINTKGRKSFTSISPNCIGMLYQDLMIDWMKERDGKIILSNGMTVLSVNEGAAKYYEYLKSSVSDRNDLNIGTFIELRDITVQQESTAQLYHLANHDQLTNLYNRRYFETQCDKMNREKYLPLSFISADLNSLKHVNDTYGHAYGDKLIIAAAGALCQFTPEGGCVSRIGGDEFVVIIPNCPEDDAKAFIGNVTAYISRHYEEPYGKLDISLGYAIRAVMSVSIDQVLKEADMVMYKDKERKKFSNRQNSRPYNI